MKRTATALVLSLALTLSLLVLPARGAESTFGPGPKHAYYFITQEEQELYDLLLEHLPALIAGETVQLTETFPSGGESRYGDQTAFLQAYSALEKDHPETFFGQPKVSCLTLPQLDPATQGWGMKCTWSIHLDYDCNWTPQAQGGRGCDPAEDYRRLRETVTALADGCRRAGVARYDQLLYLHDWLIHNNAYNLQAENKNGAYYDQALGGYAALERDVAPWHAAGALFPEYSPVCQGYSEAFKLVCNELGIPCMVEPGFAWTADKDMVLHGWNTVQMEDGRWYYIDVTWDDPGGSAQPVSGQECHTYFLRGRAFMAQDHGVDPDPDALAGFYPDTSEEDYDPAAKPTTPTILSTGLAPAEEGGTAYAATQTVLVDGAPVPFQMYALREGSGATNFIKLRDLADALDGTAAQFNVAWTPEAGIVLERATPYTTRNGQENQTPYTGDQPYAIGPATTRVDGLPLPLQAFSLNSGTSTYYKLRDLGQALGFNVGWDPQGVYVETHRPYDPNN